MAAGIVQGATIYGVIGLAVGLAFLVFGIGRRDAAARGAYTFRPLLLPGCVLLWPVVIILWARGP